MTELILSETVTRLRARTDAAHAADVGAALLTSRRYEVLFVDAPLVEAGLADLRRFSDKRLSLVDAVSFAVIRALALDGSFTFDPRLPRLRICRVSLIAVRTLTGSVRGRAVPRHAEVRRRTVRIVDRG